MGGETRMPEGARVSGTPDGESCCTVEDNGDDDGDNSTEADWEPV